MEKTLGPWTPIIYAILRIVTGFLFFQHGPRKLLADAPLDLMSLRALGATIEILGGAAIAVGLFTSPFAFLASGMMAVAYFTVHAPLAFLPIQNNGELAVMFCFVFLYFAAVGSGEWSLDGMLRRRGDLRRTRATRFTDVANHGV